MAASLAWRYFSKRPKRRQQDHLLKTGQAQLQAFNDSLPVALFMTDLLGNATYVNKTYEALSGATAQQLVGNKWFRCLHGTEQEAAAGGWVAAIAQQVPYHGVHRVLRPGCKPWWGSFKAVPMLIDQQGSGYVGSVEDITGRLEAEKALRTSEQRLRLITDNIPALIAYVTPDQRLAFANSRYQAAFNLPATGPTGMLAQDVLGADVYAQSLPYVEAALHGTPGTFERLVTHVGQLRWERVSYMPEADEQQRIAGFFSLVEDITELKQAQHTFAKSEMRLRMITDNLPALIAYIDRDERYRFCNGYYETVLGLKPEKILGAKLEEVIGLKSYKEMSPHIERVWAGERVSFEPTKLEPGKDRHFMYDFIPDFGIDKSVVGFYSMVMDISALKKVENQLRILARFDSLTGLPNRNHFEEKLDEAIARSRRSQRMMAVMFLDIDHFKDINDTMGHHGGDSVLREVACRLQRCVRKTDTVSRLAGDEFTIILEGLQAEEESAMVANKIIHAMQENFVAGDVACAVTLSIGIAIRRADEIDAELLLQRADKALYAAKSAGRNQFQNSAN